MKGNGPRLGVSTAAAMPTRAPGDPAEKECVVFYTSPGTGHLSAMVELAKRFTCTRFHPAVITTESPFRAAATRACIRQVSAACPSISFRLLPPVSLPVPCSSPHHEALIFRWHQLHDPLLMEALQSMSRTTPITALILDLFCASAVDVARHLHIPAYFFYTSAAASLAIFLHFPVIHTTTHANFKDLQGHLSIPGVPPVPPADMPLPALIREDEAYSCLLDAARRFHRADGILVNTFESLEPRPLEALREGTCLSDPPPPPVYPVGPLIATASQARDGDGCLGWLDSQPPESVVLLCFGSMGFFSAEQLVEIAAGLEQSAQRFLWVVRAPPPEREESGGGVSAPGPSKPDLDKILPGGFLERTRERGLVVGSWAPQAAALNHGSVGGFVTHCGWNSVLEAVCAGVPMLAWPLYAEQRLNRLFLVEDMRLALPLPGTDGNGVVTAAHVADSVRRLMVAAEGRMIRERLLMLRDTARAARAENGAAFSTVRALSSTWERRKPCVGPSAS